MLLTIMAYRLLYGLVTELTLSFRHFSDTDVTVLTFPLLRMRTSFKSIYSYAAKETFLCRQ